MKAYHTHQRWGADSGRRRRAGRWLAAGALCVLAGALLLLSGCKRGGTGAVTQITVAGSTSVTPFAEQLAEEFMRLHPGQHVNIQGIGSSAGIQATQSGASDIGMSSRELKEDEAQVLVPITMALDAMAVIVHPSNPVRDLSLDQVRRVFTGVESNWRALGGHDAPITLVNREAGSGTRGAFEELVVGDAHTPLSYRAIRQGSNGAVRAVVEGDPNAIGYISLGIVSPQVRALSIDGVAATPENVQQGRYKLVRPLLFVLRQNATVPDLARDFVEYTLSREGQEMLARAGLIAAPGEVPPWKR